MQYSDRKIIVHVAVGAIQIVARRVYSPSVGVLWTDYSAYRRMVDPLSASRKEGEEKIEVLTFYFACKRFVQRSIDGPKDSYGG